MQIRTLLKTTIAATLALTVGLGIMIGVVYQRLERLSSAQFQADEVNQSVLRLLVLSSEYAHHGEERAESQWRTLSTGVADKLQAAGQEEYRPPEAALEQTRLLQEFFEQLVEARQTGSGEIQARRIQLLLDQLLNHTQALSDTLRHWEDAISDQQQEVERRVRSLTLGASLLTFLAMVGLSLVLHRRILQPLGRFHEAVEAVARGDLSIRSATHYNDEFGAVSRTFDAMAVDLVSNLRQNEGMLQQILDTSSAAIFLLGKDDRLTRANLRMGEMFGCAAEQLIGMHYMDLVVPADQESASNHLKELSQEQVDSLSSERHYRRADGSVFWGYITARPFFDIEGHHHGLIGVIVDISERKAAEAELLNYQANLERLVEERTQELSRARDAAESANRAKSQFLANMSHELRTPMHAILGFTGLALRKTDDPKLTDYLGKVEHASQRLLSLINDILDISKIEAAKLSIEKRDFTLHEVLDSLLKLLGNRAQEKGIEQVVEVAPSLMNQTFHGDAMRLGQVLINLTSNAIKFTERGFVAIRIHPAEQSETEMLLNIEVEDSGIGIAPENQSRLFSPFEQADGSTTRKYGGTGLGLAICKQLVGLMGGAIGVRSENGKGSTFWLMVPLGKVDASVAPPAVHAQRQSPSPAEIRTRLQGHRILLAEDDPINQEISRTLLEEVGLEVDIAADGREAVDRANQTTYSAILMDIQMPNMNGLDAAQAIRLTEKNGDTPILAMTANAFDSDREEALRVGMNDHIGKPVRTTILYECLAKWIQ